MALYLLSTEPMYLATGWEPGEQKRRLAWALPSEAKQESWLGVGLRCSWLWSVVLEVEYNRKPPQGAEAGHTRQGAVAGRGVGVRGADMQTLCPALRYSCLWGGCKQTQVQLPVRWASGAGCNRLWLEVLGAEFTQPALADLRGWV